MKKNKFSQQGSIIKPLLKDLLKRQKIDADKRLPEVEVGSAPLSPSDLFQDAGSGYNQNFTYPQE
jgi:hypothetical protein